MCQICEQYHTEMQAHIMWICEEINQPTTKFVGIGFVVNSWKDLFDDKQYAWFEAYDFYQICLEVTPGLNHTVFEKYLQQHFEIIANERPDDIDGLQPKEEISSSIESGQNVTNNANKPRFVVNFHYKNEEDKKVVKKSSLLNELRLYIKEKILYCKLCIFKKPDLFEKRIEENSENSEKTIESYDKLNNLL